MTGEGKRAVVFAYHNVGVRGLEALLACGVDVGLVVTHEDNPEENIWFSSVEQIARLNDIPVIKPQNPNTPEALDSVRACQPDWLFSFYYRHMLGGELLGVAARGAYNLHGSLLPKYRGRVPINWAVIHGEAESGASLHRMEIKPDAGALVDQEAVPILPNDTAYQVFQKVTVAAEMVLLRAVPRLLDGTAVEIPLDLKAGSYFSGRKPEDGRIDWRQPAQQIHNLIRAVAPPYPGAFFDINSDINSDIDGDRLTLLGSYFRNEAARQQSQTRLYWQDGHCWADCRDGKRLCITQIVYNDAALDEAGFRACFGEQLLLQPK